MIPDENSIDSNGNLCGVDELCAIQDYAVAVYYSNDISVVDNYFFGRHHQTVSFKEDDHNGLVERNIFVGALYTAIFLGQNFENNAKQSSDLIARYNIVLDEENYPVKSPIRVDNVKNAIVEHNYFKDFDYSNNLSGVFVLKRAEGIINIKNNILAFGINNNNSGAFEIDDDSGCPSGQTEINIENNIVYRVHHGLTMNNCTNNVNIANNIFYQLLDDPNGETTENPGFEADPSEAELSFSHEPVDFDNLYEELTIPYTLQ